MRPFAIGLAVLALAAGAFFAGKAIFGSDDNGSGSVGSTAQGYHLDYPSTWSPAPAADVAKVPNTPLAVLKRDNNSGLFIIRHETKGANTSGSFAKQLGQQIQSRASDYVAGSTKTVQTKAGPAFYFSYGRSTAGTANAIVVVPDGATSSYVIETSSGATDQAAANEIAGMIGSFDITH